MIASKQKAANQAVCEWIGDHFLKRECVKIMPVSNDSEKCGCGRYFGNHYYFEEEKESSAYKEGYKWNVSECTAPFTTDAYGTLKFHGVARPWKSLYLRLDYTVDPNDIWQLLVHVWGLEPPKLVITIYGGGNDFDLSPALWQEFKNGLLRVANNTSVWVITSGIRVGVAKHVAAAFGEVMPRRKKANFALIGIAPWGLIRRAEKLIGSNKCLNYYPFSSQRSRFVSLCEGHNCFLLVDDGTLGRSGAEIAVRRKFEAFLTQKTMNNSSRLMPIVLLMLGGGRLAMHAATDCVHAAIPVPVVVCKNSGRAADVLAYAIEHQFEAKQNEEQFKSQLLKRIEETLETNSEEAAKWTDNVLKCVISNGHLLTIFDGLSVGNAEEQLDCKILNALLQGRSSSQVDRLSLLLAWNREDMVREMLERGVEWEESALDSVMMQALMHDRVDFVQLLLANGVAIDAFLTPERLEELYNTDKGPPNTLSTLMQDVMTDGIKGKTYSLPDIGLLIEKLMGGGYRSTYRRREFRSRYKQCLKGFLKKSQGMYCCDEVGKPRFPRRRETVICTDRVGSYFFENPFNDLFLWAVLTNRLNMAVCMWRQGDEPLAKALVGYKLFKSMAKEAKEDALEVEICDRLKSNSE
ncbi:hypothetical protein D918_08970 [Trichuris suis]|nr:hypothetical protein D918_08970 [Trichuris suis]